MNMNTNNIHNPNLLRIRIWILFVFFWLRIQIWILFVRNIHEYIRIFEYLLHSGANTTKTDGPKLLFIVCCLLHCLLSIIYSLLFVGNCLLTSVLLSLLLYYSLSVADLSRHVCSFLLSLDIDDCPTGWRYDHGPTNVGPW